MPPVFHALVLNLHQPSGNLDALLRDDEWEARQILYALDRISRSLGDYADGGRVHPRVRHGLAEAHWRLLRAETSCHFFWGEAWVPRCHQDLHAVWAALAEIKSQVPWLGENPDS